MEEEHPLEVLLVEDDPSDVELLQATLRRSKLVLRLHTAWDGDEALRYLRREGAFAGAPRPDLVLLDLNLPGMSGQEVLRRIRNDDGLKTLPVVVLTGSQEDEDILRSYDLGANCYILKPPGLHEFEKVIGSIQDFWFTIVKLPREAAPAQPAWSTRERGSTRRFL